MSWTQARYSALVCKIAQSTAGVEPDSLGKELIILHTRLMCHQKPDRSVCKVAGPIFTEDGRAVLLREALQAGTVALLVVRSRAIFNEVLLGRVADLRQRRSFLACLVPSCERP